MFLQWSQTAKAPKAFWIGAFTFPTGFLTAVMQTAARAHGVGVDTLSWDFNVLTISEQNIPSSPKEGVYVSGLFLEGAGWDMKNQCLVEAAPMMLVCTMPVIHFKAIENKKKTSKCELFVIFLTEQDIHFMNLLLQICTLATYICPCYYYQNRSGPPGKPSFMIGVELKTGDFPSEHWVKRGTALLMSLDN